MPKSNTPLSLAKSADQWKQLEAIVRQQVEIVCFQYDDKEQADAFLCLLDLVTSEQYDRLDREALARVMKRHAFTFTSAFDKAIDASLKRAA